MTKRARRPPAFFRKVLESLWPTAVRLELFATSARPGWKAWGSSVAADRFRSSAETQAAQSAVSTGRGRV